MKYADSDHERLNARLDELTDADWAAMDRLGVALEAADRDGLTASTAARTAKIVRADGKTDTHTAGRILDLMVAARFALTSGNGAWIHYHPYDRSSDPTLDPTWEPNR